MEIHLHNAAEYHQVSHTCLISKIGFMYVIFAFTDASFLYARSETSDVLGYGVRLSVCLSVRPSINHIMSAQYLEKFMSDSHSTL